MSPRVVVAPDKFKGSLSAGAVAVAVAAGLRRARPAVAVTELPVADGGDGTVDAVCAAGFDRVEVSATGPTGSPVRAAYALRGATAVVELAAVVGIERLPGGTPDPLGATTYGLGTVIRHALDAGVERIVIGVGGSASTDGGVGMLQALGFRFLDSAGAELAPGGGSLSELARVDPSGCDPRLEAVAITIASDVDNPLCGPTGAAAVYGPQKGASPQDVTRLAAGLERLAKATRSAGFPDVTELPGAGAAGGAGFGAMAYLGADVESGIELVLDLVGFDTAVAKADLVVTGEGSLDEQSLHGKVPVGVARVAAQHRVPTVAVAGRCLLSVGQLNRAGIEAAYPLSAVEPEQARSMRHAAALLERVAHRIGEQWL